MTETNDIPESNDAAQMTCSINGGCKNHGLYRAVAYTPVVVIISGLAAMAMFPEIAEYATPLIGGSKKARPTCQNMSPASCPASTSAEGCSGHSDGLASPCSSEMGCASSEMSCCSKSQAASTESTESAAEAVQTTDNASTTDDAPASTNAEVVNETTVSNDAPADALSVVSGVVQPTESN